MIRTEEFQINMGPQHPSTHGVFRAVLTMDGEAVNRVDPMIGYLHRGIEKICESRNYSQIIPLTDRLDYLSAMSNNIVYCMAVEKLMGLEIPDRAIVLRMLIAELQRIASHMIFIGTMGIDVGAVSVFFYTMREREHIMNLFEKLCGARLIYNFMRIGGLAHDLPENFEKETIEFIDIMEKKVDEYNDLLSENHIFKNRMQGIGLISKETALSYALSGPVGRASDVNYDVRKNDPYLWYHKLNFTVPVFVQGDCFSRYMLRIIEVKESVKIIRQCLDMLKPGSVRVQVPRVIKPPVGQVYAHVENPRGDLGVFIVSDGTANPYRVKFRAPSFVNLSVISEASKNLKIADLVLTLGSLDPVFGEVDR
ncbi:MAG: NADH-quinone oxidoreductase subunit D [Candidatus Riflebacteria bacterium]|nr:NADH-quinone oxidoreductase subunit D [Candidatus Riflebacteria bacterium]